MVIATKLMTVMSVTELSIEIMSYLFSWEISALLVATNTEWTDLTKNLTMNAARDVLGNVKKIRSRMTDSDSFIIMGPALSVVRGMVNDPSTIEKGLKSMETMTIMTTMIHIQETKCTKTEIHSGTYPYKCKAVNPTTNLSIFMTNHDFPCKVVYANLTPMTLDGDTLLTYQHTN